MGEADTHTFDLYRIFIGDQPLDFLIEILFRTVVMYLYVLLVLRLLGKRGMGQLSPFEFTIIIALGSAVGDPMFYPEVPLLHCLAVVTVVVAMSRFITYLSNRSEAVEDFLEGQPCCVVTDGELNIDAIDGERFSREELFMLLRERNVCQLGQVRQAYLEPSGAISAFRAQEDRCKPGLPIIPPYDEWTPAPDLVVTGRMRKAGTLYVCWKCGHAEATENEGESTPCGRCESDDWAEAKLDPFS
ncbi:MAG TPA: YetF domain-containing protein [Terrimicrobiaceae bacterium]|nr:YetF domain-containing protein [Terrimicrobiaceae bacterium]